MSGPAENSPADPPSDSASDRLDSWKEIAAYLRRGVSTVQRWEREEGLPTHRLHHGKLGSVYAFKSELDRWVRDRRERVDPEAEAASTGNGGPGPEPEGAGVAGEPVVAPSGSPTESARAGSPEPDRTRLVPWLTLGATLLIGLLALSRIASPPPPTASPDGPRALPITSSRGIERHPALSPDGRQLAYVSNEAAETFDLYVKDVDSPKTLRLTTSAESECCAAWSPDQRSLAFLRLVGNEAVLLTMPAMGGPEQRRVGLVHWFGSALSWSPDGRFVAYSDRASPGGAFVVKLLEMETGQVRLLTTAAAAFIGDAFPRISPDGRQVAFARLTTTGDVSTADLYVVGVKGGEPARITREQRFVGDVEWTADSRELLFFSNRSHAVRLWRVSLQGREPGLVWPGGDPFPTDSFAEAMMDVSHAFRFSSA
ncbi:MAG TPA: hypothetical protein VI589_13735, partial [Vicinamibacteria bacterium]